MTAKQKEQKLVCNVVKDLEGLVIPIDSLTPDPDNARSHNIRNLNTIAASLQSHGQRTPVVVQRQADGRLVIRKGNGTTEAARELLGWTGIAAVVVEEGDVEAMAYAIRDNRSAELAEWDKDKLGRAMEMVQAAMPQVLPDLGFDEAEIKGLIDLNTAWLDGLGEDDSEADSEADSNDDSADQEEAANPSAGYVQFALSMTPEQRDRLVEALNLAKQKLNTDSSGEALSYIADAYLKRQATT